MKETRDKIKRRNRNNNDLDSIQEVEADERTQLLTGGYDPRQSYDAEVEDEMQRKRSSYMCLNHAWMFFLLVLIVTLYIKNDYKYSSQEYTYLFALTLPLIALVVITGLILYFNYVIKLYDSHGT